MSKYYREVIWKVNILFKYWIKHFKALWNTHQHSWPLMRTHKPSWDIMSSHEHLGVLLSSHEHSVALMSTKKHSWVWCHGNRSAHECYWRYVIMLMNVHECPWVLIAALGWSWAAVSRNECSLLLVSIHEHSWAWLHSSARTTHEHSWCHGTSVMNAT